MAIARENIFPKKFPDKRINKSIIEAPLKTHCKGLESLAIYNSPTGLTPRKQSGANAKLEKGNMTMQTNLTLKSRNQKTGDIPVSTTSADSCPDSCPLKAAGCYAEAGPLGLFWRKVTELKAGVSFESFLKLIAALPLGVLWRHNQSGDLIPDIKDKKKIDAEKLRRLVIANKGKKGFTYTHHDPEYLDNGLQIKAANLLGFTINLSGNNFDHADSLAALNCGPVVTVAPIEFERLHKKEKGLVTWLESLAAYKERVESLGLKTKAGRQVVICPATWTDNINCKNCALCQKQRESIVAFPAHGVSKKKANAIATGAA